MTTNNINRFENFIKYGLDKDIDKIKIWCKFQVSIEYFLCVLSGWKVNLVGALGCSNCEIPTKEVLLKIYDKLWIQGTFPNNLEQAIVEAQGLNNYPTIRHPRKHAQNYKKHIYDRTFQVKINNTLSEPFSNHNGVVQGSSISPPTVIKLFADDSLINCKGKNINLVKTQIQLTLDKLSKWSLKTGFTFSPNKRKCILFTRQRKIA
ncbi:hypothetical protein ACI65C_007595 [Semiaphis heraclei]